jgi:hypothetical protein
MADLTPHDHHVLSAIDNESEGLTREDRENNRAEQQAWNNAQIYADMYEMTVAEFRATFIKLTGLDFTERVNVNPTGRAPLRWHLCK